MFSTSGAEDGASLIFATIFVLNSIQLFGFRNKTVEERFVCEDVLDADNKCETVNEKKKAGFDVKKESLHLQNNWKSKEPYTDLETTALLNVNSDIQLKWDQKGEKTNTSTSCQRTFTDSA